MDWTTEWRNHVVQVPYRGAINATATSDTGLVHDLDPFHRLYLRTPVPKLEPPDHVPHAWYCVATVQLGIAFCGPYLCDDFSVDYWYETMVFDGNRAGEILSLEDEYATDRYRTRWEAIAGHFAMVDRVTSPWVRQLEFYARMSRTRP